MLEEEWKDAIVGWELMMFVEWFNAFRSNCILQGESEKRKVD
jgi:hypothetical protein